MVKCGKVGTPRRTTPARKGGFVMIALALSIFFLLGVVGLAVDLGRMYVVKNESQSFCDSAALFAAKELDGTADGIAKAVNKVTWVAQDPNGPMKGFEFGTRQFQNIITEFATNWNGPTWVDAAAAAADPTDYYFVRVRTSNSVNLWFLPVIVGSDAGSVAAVAVAGRAVEDTMVQGLAPFAPFQLPTDYTLCTAAELAGCSIDPNDRFGMVKGEWYTIRWMSGNLKKDEIPNFCPGDRCECMMKMANASAASAGYALYQGARDIREAIVGTPPLGTPITIGSEIPLDNGEMQTEMRALDDRIAQDTDQTSNHYMPEWSGYPGQPTSPNSYSGNGRRIMVTPVQSAAGGMDGNAKLNTVVGFAGFFLGPLCPDLSTSCKDQNRTYEQFPPSKKSACAQYLGEFTIGAPGSGGSGPGGSTVYTLRLYR
ncbi:MAG TPA: Tad domain-containing protein [Bryobacteraceae bacterium]|nr:Tad domain-containing protein [Bryobacteraceae bacterium]HPQ17037.1 Tad domain-containing protein [Bryobacteraceae bacterium]